MLAIKTPSGIFLDLSPGSSMQMERTSPFFAQDSLSEEYSLPITFPFTPKNARELGLQTHYYTQRVRRRIEGVQLYDGRNFCYTGDLIITSCKINVNNPSKGTISGFFQTGVSSFFGAIKNKKLRELELGGPRQFAWTNNDPASSSEGFWQHIHRTLDGSMDYSFGPIRNQLWSGSTEEGTADWMNKLTGTGVLDYEANFNTLAPQVRMKYVLEQIFEEHGWTFDYSDMGDTQWETLFMPSFYAVSWKRIIITETEPYFDTTPLPTITINLQNHVPPEMLITSFIIALVSKYNWGFEFDAGRRTARMFPLKSLAIGTRKDWTPYMPAELDSDFSEEPKVIAFKNEIDSGDALSGAPDFNTIELDTPAFEVLELPEATEDLFNKVIFCWKENQYYQCLYDEATTSYYWELYGNGIYNDEPTGTNAEYTSEASTMPVYRTHYRSSDLLDYYGLFPYCEQEGNWEGKQGAFVPWGLRLLFHRGYVFEATPTNFPGPQKYPYLTSVISTITQSEPDLAWSNVYRHILGPADFGIINYWWRDILPYLQAGEVVSMPLYLPRKELKEHRWSDIILLRNIPYIAQVLPDTIPYKGYVEAKLRRIG